MKGFVLDERGRRIEAIHVAGHGKRATILGWSAVAAFGAEAVMAVAGADVSAVEDDHQEDIGTVDDVEFDVDSGDLVRVDTDHGPIEVDRLRSLGSYALVVDDRDAASAPAAR